MTATDGVTPGSPGRQGVVGVVGVVAAVKVTVVVALIVPLPEVVVFCESSEIGWMA